MSVAELLVLLLGLLSGSLVNWLIYTVAYNPRPISPWNKPHSAAPPRRWFDFIPVVGWISLRRESPVHGRGFWIRPLLIELGLAIGLMLLYRHETSGALFPQFCRNAKFLTVNWTWILTTFTVHSLLIVLMTAATFIDFDEQTIPDAITLPGTILGLLAAAITPNIYLPNLAMNIRGAAGNNPVEPTLLHIPGIWPGELNGVQGLMIGLFIVAMWCFALMDRRVIMRQGFSKAVEYFFARMFRDGLWKLIFVITGVVAVGVACTWTIGGAHWQGLLTALVGLAIGGGVVWGVRLIAGWAMGMEAMGFGDVILMGMIGTFLGWQAALLAFMLAPFTSLAIALTYYLLTGKNRLAFGPYLCAGSVLVIIFWDRIWNPPAGVSHLFTVPSLLLSVFLVSLAAMGLMLRLLRLARGG